MDFRQLSDEELVNFSQNIHARLAGHEIACIDNALADDLAAEIAPLNAAFETQIDTCVELVTSKESGFALKAEQREEIEKRIVRVRNTLTANEGMASDFEKCGFDPRKLTRTPVVPNAPTDLAGEGASNGVNTLRFKGNNKPGYVSYEIWRRHGDTSDWYFLARTGKQSFVDQPVTPGEYYEYKVRAVAAKHISPWSNTAVVYGTP